MNRTDLRHAFSPWAVVAGASEGLGRACAEALAALGLDVVPLARRGEPLEAIATTLPSALGVAAHPVVLDLAADDVEAQLRAAVAGRDVGLLVYDAAATHIQPFSDAPLDAHRRIVDVNCHDPLAACHEPVPGLRARSRRHRADVEHVVAAGLGADRQLCGKQGLQHHPRRHPVGGTASRRRARARQHRRSHQYPVLPPQHAGGQAAQGAADDPRGGGRGDPRCAGPGPRPPLVPGRVNRLVYALSNLFGSRARTRFFSGSTRDLYG